MHVLQQRSLLLGVIRLRYNGQTALERKLMLRLCLGEDSSLCLYLCSIKFDMTSVNGFHKLRVDIAGLREHYDEWWSLITLINLLISAEVSQILRDWQVELMESCGRDGRLH